MRNRQPDNAAYWVYVGGQFLLALLLLGCLLAAVTALTAQAGQFAVPNDSLTPGAVATDDVQDICGKVGGLTYTKRHRVWEDKRSTLQKYGLSVSDAPKYEDDDRVPVCLGGNNADPKNHWPQAWPEAKIKDRLDAGACRMVCEGKVPLATARSWFLGDWRKGYEAAFGEAP